MGLQLERRAVRSCRWLAVGRVSAGYNLTPPQKKKGKKRGILEFVKVVKVVWGCVFPTHLAL